MDKKQIPKMIYVIRWINTKKQVNAEAINGIREQSNLFGVYYMLPKLVYIIDKWFVMIENDVQLPKGWIEEMWKYKDFGDVIMGRAVQHPVVREYKRKTTKVEETDERYLQCALVRGGKYLDDDAKWISVPVIVDHCPSYKHSPYRQGTMKNIPMKRILKTILGGIKISLKEKHWIFARNSILRGAGMLMRKIL